MKKTTQTGRAFTIAEMLMALAVLAMLLSAVAVAMQGVLQGYGENTKIADVTHTSRVVLDRMMSEIRTAEAVDCDTQRVSIVPPDNGEGLTKIEYELVEGVLYCRRTVNGTETSRVLIASDGAVRIEGFNVVRETGIDGEGFTYTRSVTARLDLAAGDNQFQITASACPRRNLTY